MLLSITNPSSYKLLVIALSFVFVQYYIDANAYNAYLLKKQSALNRRKKKRLKWSEINLRISDRHFRRMFRMTRPCFHLLCQTIIKSIGESAFKSEQYIDAFLDLPRNALSKCKQVQMHQAHVDTCGGYVSGEVKLGITLRMLAGGDSLDLGAIFDISVSHIRAIFIDVVEHWIVDNNIGNINMAAYLDNPEALTKVSLGFSSRSNGVLVGAIGAIDGWLVKITRPNKRWDDHVKNVSGFFSRKGFYALNVQCLVDHEKKVLWAKINNKGASHDSSCFRDSTLYTALKDKWKQLCDKGLFILGDSAYAIESFIIPPYDGAKPMTPEDHFNFYHSSARITVECAFGEIDLRWGIFWKRLSSTLNHTFIIINAAMHLHNFLVTFRNNAADSKRIYATDRSIFVNDMLDNGIFNVVVTNDDHGGDGGRPPNDERDRRVHGIELRNKLRDKFVDHNMHRPRNDNDFQYDRSNHIDDTEIDV